MIKDKKKSLYGLNLNPVNLKFRGGIAGLENQYNIQYTGNSLVYVRITLVLGFLLYSIFGILDSIMVPDLKYQFYFIRFAVVCPVLIVAVILSYTDLFRKYMQLILSATIFIAGLGIVRMIILAPPPVNYSYYAGLMLVLMYLHTMMRLKFTYATVTGWLIVAFYEYAAISTNTPVDIIVNNNFFFISCNLIAMFSSYSIEYYNRRGYYYSYLMGMEKESQWKTLTENSPDLILKTDLNGTITFVNKDDKVLATSKILGNSISNIVSKNDSAKIESIFKGCIETSELRSIEVQVKQKDDQIRLYNMVFVPIIHEETVTSVIVRIADISERKKAEAELIKNNERSAARAEILSFASKDASEGEIIQHALDIVGPLLKLSRASYVEMNKDRTQCICTVEWTEEGVKNSVGARAPAKLIDFVVKNNIEVINSDVIKDRLPGLLKPLFDSTVKMVLKKFDIETLWFIPLIIGGEVEGVLGYDICYSNPYKPEFTEETRLFLFEVRDIIVNIIEKNRAKEEKTKIQEQLFQSQKMESMGVLAGGIAHDFNNILTAIMGDTELLITDDTVPEINRAELDSIKKNTRRASELVKQLLAFSRKQLVDMAAVDLNWILKNSMKMLERLIGEHIKLETVLKEKNLFIICDPGNIEQVLVNLLVNSKDAIEKTGNITISVDRYNYSKNDAILMGKIKQGECARLVLEDNGKGMPDEVRKRVFEPFFTTKTMGKGTGLGLSVVFGILNAHNAAVNVESKEGKGTKITIYFPLTDEKEIKEAERKKKEIHGKGEKILVIEDEVDIRTIIKKVFERRHYETLFAKTVNEAVKLYKKDPESIDLVFSDMVLPDGNGLDALYEMNKIKPVKKILFTSGYLDNMSRWSEIQENNYPFLHKPYTVQELIEKINDILGV